MKTLIIGLFPIVVLFCVLIYCLTIGERKFPIK